MGPVILSSLLGIPMHVILRFSGSVTSIVQRPLPRYTAVDTMYLEN